MRMRKVMSPVIPDSGFSMVRLQNLASGAPWEPRFFELDRTGKKSRAIRRMASMPSKPSGLGSRLLVVLNGRLTSRFLAVYFIDGEWKLFDGECERSLANTTAVWRKDTSIAGGLGLAVLSLELPGSMKTITYFRPWLRHWFEGGWSLDDVDMGCVTASLIGSEAARSRLASALQSP